MFVFFYMFFIEQDLCVILFLIFIFILDFIVVILLVNYCYVCCIKVEEEMGYNVEDSFVIFNRSCLNEYIVFYYFFGKIIYYNYYLWYIV